MPSHKDSRGGESRSQESLNPPKKLLAVNGHQGMGCVGEEQASLTELYHW